MPDAPPQTASEHFHKEATDTQLAMFSGQLGTDFSVDQFKAELDNIVKSVLPQYTAFLSLGVYGIPSDEMVSITKYRGEMLGAVQLWINRGRLWPVPTTSPV